MSHFRQLHHQHDPVGSPDFEHVPLSESDGMTTPGDHSPSKGYRPVAKPQTAGHLATVLCHAWRDDLLSSDFLPVRKWIRTYNRRKAFGDIMAGVTVAVMLIPQGLAYSVLAGLPPVYGLYSSLLPLVIYTLMGSSMRLTVGPVAPTCIMISSALNGLSITTPEDYTRLALSMAFVGGVFQLLLGLFRAGKVANLLSWPVKTGYMAAAAMVIVSSQLKDVLGLTIERDDNFFITTYRSLVGIPTCNWITILFSVATLLILFGVKYIPKLPNWFPTPLLLMVVMLVISGVTHVSEKGVKIVGHVPVGLPGFTVPFATFDDIMIILPSAIAVSFVAYVGSISLALAFAQDPFEVDPNQELFAFGVASIVGSFTSSFVISGSFTRAALNVQAGAVTPAANTFTAMFVLVVLLVLAPFFEYLPTAVLGAIIVNTAVQLVKMDDVKKLWRASKIDFAQCIISFVAVLIWGMQIGIAIGVGVSVGLLLVFKYRPHYHALKLRASATASDSALVGFSTTSAVQVLTCEGDLHFANATAFCTRIRVLLTDVAPAKPASPPPSPRAKDNTGNAIELSDFKPAGRSTSSHRLLDAQPSPADDSDTSDTEEADRDVDEALKAIVLDLHEARYIDATAGQQLQSVAGACAKAKIPLFVAAAPHDSLARLEVFGFKKTAFFETVGAAIDAAKRSSEL